jgi:outer membrane protein OmpA-like peptidoglycan-associated protein
MTDRSRRACSVAALVAALVVVAGCASKGNVVLLPEQDGRQTAVTVRQGDKEITLDKPYAAAKVTAGGPSAYQSTPQEVDAQFGAARAALPARATSFTVYFVENKDEFTDESKQVVPQIFAEIAKRPVPDVMVVGHTDTVGNDQQNDPLGQKRADTVRVLLIQLGLPADDIRAISRGKRALAVPTADGVAEPRNRRVEIIVR